MKDAEEYTFHGETFAPFTMPWGATKVDRLKVYLNRLKELYELIDSLPEEQVYLDAVHTRKDDGNTIPTYQADEIALCDSVCCIAGWAWIHEPFVRAGIRGIEAKGVMAAANLFFGLPATDRFTVGTEPHEEHMTQKEAALKRISDKIDKTAQQLLDELYRVEHDDRAREEALRQIEEGE